MKRATKRSGFTSRPLGVESLEQRMVLATFVASVPNNDGPGSLRDAIEQANLTPGADVVEIAPNLAFLFLEDTPISITDSVDVVSNRLVRPLIRTTDSLGIFDIDGFDGMEVTFRNLILDGGIQEPPMGATFPGTIRSHDASVTVDHVTVQNTMVPQGNYAVRVSALAITGSDIDVTVRDSLFSGNSGGAQLANRNAVQISASGSSSVEIRDSRIEDSVSSARGLYVGLGGDSSLVLANSTITDSTYVGAAIVLFGDATANVYGNEFTHHSQSRGLSLLLDDQSSALFERNHIAYNAGGAVIDLRNNATIQFSDNVVKQNSITYPTYFPDGGGLRLFASGDTAASVRGSEFTDNATTGLGGGFAAVVEDNAQLEIGDTTIQGNSTALGAGGVHVRSTSNRSVSLQQSTVSGNSSGGPGGGVRLVASGSAEIEMVNSTVSGNSSASYGGGILLEGTGQKRLRHSTVTENTSALSGGGIFGPLSAPNPMGMSHSIVANNDAPLSSDAYADVDPSASDFNLIGDGTGLNLIDGQAGNQVGTTASPLDALLGPLGTNGGDTPTHALIANSPALNAGDPVIQDSGAFDQRGFPYMRVGFGQVDIGAFERQPPTHPDFNGDGQLDCADIDALVAAIVAGSSDTQFDLNLDQVVNLGDVAIWLAHAGHDAGYAAPVLSGDANLDGDVDGIDFIIWNQHKFSASAGWCSGDFNADGKINGFDFLLWHNNRFTGVRPSQPPQEPAQVSRATTMTRVDGLDQPDRRPMPVQLGVRRFSGVDLQTWFHSWCGKTSAMSCPDSGESGYRSSRVIQRHPAAHGLVDLMSRTGASCGFSEVSREDNRD